MNANQIIGMKIRELRKKKNLSGEALALRLKVARQTVWRWETGRCKIEVEDLKAIGKIFNKSVMYFYKGL